jgi:PAB-dependent poly(A)-specific ribonuclease subunit 2
MIELIRPDIPELIDKLFSRAIVLKTGLVEGQSVAQALEDHPGHTLVSVIYRVTSTGQPTPRGQSAGIGHHVAVVSLMDDFDTAGGRRSRSQSTIPGVTSGTSSPSIAEPEEEWILFNDFVVTMSSFEEAIGVCSWRRPMVAMYVNRELLGSALDIHHGKSPITADMFRKDVNLSLEQVGKSTFTALAEEEIDQILKGDFTVALDTEFVSVGLGAVEIREDGSREIGKPGDMVVGRVSVIRVKDDSSDPMDAVPFIDHYVAMDEDEIKDYVTRFSGIRPGDLDVKKSLHWLVSSKAIYLKLRFLVDCGCKFVGHGLHTDFRIINLWIPAGSLIDTVQLFHLEGQRFLSLKFLANRLLNRAIQTEVHCSIEDARTALEIYRVYLARKVDGTLEQTIKSLYDYGRSSGWK